MRLPIRLRTNTRHSGRNRRITPGGALGSLRGIRRSGRRRYFGGHIFRYQFPIHESLLFVQENDRIHTSPTIVAVGTRHGDISLLVGTTILTTPDVLDGRHVLPYTIFTIMSRPCPLAAITTPMVLLFRKFHQSFRIAMLRITTTPDFGKEARFVGFREIKKNHAVLADTRFNNPYFWIGFWVGPYRRFLDVSKRAYLISFDFAMSVCFVMLQPHTCFCQYRSVTD